MSGVYVVGRGSSGRTWSGRSLNLFITLGCSKAIFVFLTGGPTSDAFK